jgi:hypothetical protein
LDTRIHGEEIIASSAVPLKAVRMPDEAVSPTESVPISGSIIGEVLGTPDVMSPAPVELDAKHMRVLVAEDDPINSKIVEKRLKKLDHNVYLTVNGEECASAFCDKPRDFDVILMDMQVSEVELRLSGLLLMLLKDADR